MAFVIAVSFLGNLIYLGLLFTKDINTSLAILDMLALLITWRSAVTVWKFPGSEKT